MTVSATAPRNDYLGNGSTATYSYGFKIFAATDLRVTVQDTAGALTRLVYLTDYTMTGVGNAAGGTITLLAGNLTSGYLLTLRFDRTPIQSTDLRNQGGFFAEVHETKFDELTRYIQQNKDALDRSIRLPETETGTEIATVLPPVALRANSRLAFDDQGNLTTVMGDVAGAAVSGFGATLIDDASPAAARATLGVPAASAGAMINGVFTTCTASADPLVALGLATKQYVDNASAGTVQSYTGTDTLDDGVRLAVLSGATFTLSLPSAASNNGRQVTFLHNGTSLSQVYTIDPNGAQTIDGTATFLLYTAGERLTVISDGTTWIKLHHYAQTDWADAGAMTIAGTSVDPTKPTTPDYDHVFWRRSGKEAYVRWVLQISSAAGSAAGTGTYVFGTPAGITIDATTWAAVPTAWATATMSEGIRAAMSGGGKVVIDSTSYDSVLPFAYASNNVMFVREAANSAIGSTNYALTNGEMGYYLEAHFTAANWR